MASKLTKSNLIKTVARGYSVHPQAAPQVVAATGALQISKLNNGVTVASLDTNSIVARIGVVLRAGSRYENVPGASFIWSKCATGGLSSEQRTGFNLVRSIEQNGSQLDCVADRETAAYSMVSSADQMAESLGLLASASSNASFRYYEYPSVGYDRRIDAVLSLSPEQRALDLAVKAAYRAQPLANSIYVPDYNRGISAEQVNEFVRSTHSANGMVVVGTGVDHSVLEDGALAMGVPGAKQASVGQPTKYLGGDLRLETGGNSAVVAVFGEASKIGTSEAVAAAVAAQLLGGGSSVPFGSNSSSVATKALKGASGTVRGVSLAYSDTGLLGFVLKSTAADAPAAVASIVAAVKNLTASEKDLAGAKARAKSAILEAESGCSSLLTIGNQLLLTGNYVTSENALKAVDAVTPAAVTKALATAFSGKMTVAAVGNVRDVPYSDSL